MGELVPIAKAAKKILTILFVIQLICMPVMTVLYSLLYKDVKQCQTYGLTLAIGCGLASISAFIGFVVYKDVTGENDARCCNLLLAMLMFYSSYALILVTLCILLMIRSSACYAEMTNLVSICSLGMLINYIAQIIVGLFFCKTEKYTEDVPDTEVKQH